jgi:hypothetical protein
MTATAERSLDDQVKRTLATLKRRRIFKVGMAVVLLVAAGSLLLLLTGIMYQAPLDTLKPQESDAPARGAAPEQPQPRPAYP